jgi:adenylate kinase
MFRAAIKNETPLGLEVKAIIAEGALVPDELTTRLVAERLGQGDAGNGFLLDGFPRTQPQGEALAGVLTDLGRTLNKVVLFSCPDDVLVARITGRRFCECGASYHVEFVPPQTAGVCDRCGKELFQREDDQEDTVRNRLAVYHENTTPLIDYYRSQGNLVEIDAAEGTPDDVWGRLKEALS